jgi:DNA-directed RNA polymerase specialized sigma24 family protein
MSELKNYALTAQQHLPRSKERQVALSKLITAIQKPGCLCKPSLTFGAKRQDVITEGRSRLYLFICEQIDRYDPERGEVLQWINNRLRYLYIEAYRDLSSQGKGRVTILSLDDLENQRFPFLESQKTPSMEGKLYRCLEEDADGSFSQAYTQIPAANFQFIALRRLDGYTWKQISSQLNNISVSTLSSFYRRNLESFVPLLQKYL